MLHWTLLAHSNYVCLNTLIFSFLLLPVTTHLLPLPLYNPIPHESSDLTKQLPLFCELFQAHATTSISTKFTWQDTELDYLVY